MEEANGYYKLFPALIKNWRKEWGYDFPFLFVQLANYQKDFDFPTDYAWAHLREAQAGALKLPKTGMAVAIDLGDVNDIHPLNKKDVAHRLVLNAKKIAYNEEINNSGPVFKDVNIDGDSLVVSFDNIGGGYLVEDRYGYIKGICISKC